MRSALYQSFGDPTQVLALGDAPLPQPQAGELRIRTLLAPIHNHDLLTVRGQYGYRPALPAIGGSEAVGIVDALGEGVEGLAVGQRVATPAGRGTWAEYFIAPARMTVPLPDGIPDETAAQLMAMPLSALMLLETLALPAGAWIVQNAANGAVGKALAMLAGARGLQVVNIVRREEGVAALTALGLAHVVCSAHADWMQQVRAIIGPGLAQAAIDSVGGRASGALLALLGEGGVLVSFGALTGEPMQLSPADLIFKQATVKGFWGSKASQVLSAGDRRRLVGELLQRALAGELRLPVDAVHDLADIAQAAAASLRPGRPGKVLLRP
ncbi:zinc-binding dehydrogenase [Thermomonas sp.]|uniref:zinc-binding dehydrogenase n=1 Tax=Thermomonas sp. TaxID=1971895 RepID=UPI003D14B05E